MITFAYHSSRYLFYVPLPPPRFTIHPNYKDSLIKRSIWWFLCRYFKDGWTYTNLRRLCIIIKHGIYSRELKMLRKRRKKIFENYEKSGKTTQSKIRQTRSPDQVSPLLTERARMQSCNTLSLTKQRTNRPDNQSSTVKVLKQSKN
jgi:hypothetical protein